jgi:hypothetical protein
MTVACIATDEKTAAADAEVAIALFARQTPPHTHTHRPHQPIIYMPAGVWEQLTQGCGAGPGLLAQAGGTCVAAR